MSQTSVLVVSWLPQLLSTWALLRLKWCNCRQSKVKGAEENYGGVEILTKGDQAYT